MWKTVEGSNSDIRLENESMSVKIPPSSLTVCGTLNRYPFCALISSFAEWLRIIITSALEIVMNQKALVNVKS